MNHGGDLSHLPEGFQYIPDFLSKEEVHAWVSWVEQLTFRHQLARGRPMRRGYAMFGFEYITDGRKIRPASPFPERLKSLSIGIVGLSPAGTEFNQCIVTRYPAGAGIGWHTDAASFRGCVAGLSFGADGLFLIRRRGEARASHTLAITAGSLYVMAGSSRWDYEHSLKAVKATRYSLTFRHVGAESETTS